MSYNSVCAGGERQSAMQRFYAFFLLSIILCMTPNTVPASSQTDVVEKLTSAASKLYASIHETDVRFMLKTMTKSGLLANDMKKAGKSKSWGDAVTKCANSDFASSNCTKIGKLLQTVYGKLLSGPNITSNPNKFDNYDYLASWIIEEGLYKKKTPVVALAMAGTGGHGAPTMWCMLVKTEGKSNQSCGISAFGNAGDPSPATFDSAEYGFQGGISGNSLRENSTISQANPCPIDLSKVNGGHVSDPDDNGDSDTVKETPNSSGEKSSQDASTNKDKSEKDKVSTTSDKNDPASSVEKKSDEGVPTTQNYIVPQMPEALKSTNIFDSIEKKYGIDEYGVNIPETPLHIAPTFKDINGIRFTVTFMPRPDSDITPQSICGGENGIIKNILDGCFGNDSSDSTDIGPVDPAPPYANGGHFGTPGNDSFAMMGNGCDQFLEFIEHGGAYDPAPEGDPSSAGNDGGNNPCAGTLAGGKPSPECCAQNPTHPGCGNGGNPIYFESQINGLQRQFKNLRPMIDKKTIRSKGITITAH